MENSVSEKCITCNAPLKYDAKNDIFKCEYCGNSFTINELKDYKEKLIVKNISKETKMINTMDVSVYNCENCGATIILGDNTASTSCVYCKSSAVIKGRLEGVFAPSRIITFKFNKEDAIDRFKKICQGRKLMPDYFDDINNIQDMEGLYVPFWIYSCENKVDLIASCTKVSRWTTLNYINTKTDYYNVTGNGTLIFDKVPNDAATRFDDIIMNAIEPFDYKGFVPFEQAYLSGYISEKYDVEAKDAYKNVEERINNGSKKYLLSKIQGYSSKCIKSFNSNVDVKVKEYVLLPVWVLNIKYKEKIYRFSMNGQTGKFVGEIPVDKGKLWRIILLSFGIPFIIILVCLFILGGIL